MFPCFDDAKVRRIANTRKSIQRTRWILQRNGSKVSLPWSHLTFSVAYLIYL